MCYSLLASQKAKTQRVILLSLVNIYVLAVHTLRRKVVDDKPNCGIDLLQDSMTVQ